MTKTAEMLEVVSCVPEGKAKYRVRFDNDRICLLYRGEVRAFHIEEGALLSHSDYDRLMNEVLRKRAIKRAMHLLEQMDQTEYQLRDKLKRGEYPPDCIDAAIEYVRRFHYLDDARFADTYVRYHMDRMSEGQLRQKLLQKGVGKTDIAEALRLCGEVDETAQIQALLEKKHFDPLNCDRKEYVRIYQFLLRRGFKNADISRAMRCEECTRYSVADWD